MCEIYKRTFRLSITKAQSPEYVAEDTTCS